MRIVATLFPIIPLAGCMVTPPGQPNVGDPGRLCSNDSLAQFAGQPATQDVGARMLATSGARTIRWVPKGGMVTMDFRGDRLTVQLDAGNRIETARCG